MTLATKWFTALPAFQASEQPVPAQKRAVHISIALLIFAIALAARFLLDPYLPVGFPYLTFFPAVIITGFLFGVPLGGLVATLSGLSAWYYFIPPFHSFALNSGKTIAICFFVFIILVDLGLIHLMTKAYKAEARAKADKERIVDYQDVMVNELDHRIKNIFATMNAVISMSQRHAKTPEELGAKLRERLDAMGRSNLLLRGLAGKDDATLPAVLSKALAPFGVQDSGRLIAHGAAIPVSGQAIVVLSLIFHELGTNAAKYGALSAPAGTLSVLWDIRDIDGCPTVCINWSEKGGPAPAPSGINGFGSTLIKRISGTLGGTAETNYAPHGAEIVIRLPLRGISAYPTIP
ncbi:sensor histidine kinase [Rhizobium sp. CFBP 8762]|uniref:sensor histidine kinase n=1 Tax=Rhizobium sp. CFBP 8762 TaxID=2775279 RepID=UPI001A7E73C5|nr:HWE histidine kinase domain-containing protein [Rhizobium sp. CFBP 8762]